MTDLALVPQPKKTDFFSGTYNLKSEDRSRLVSYTLGADLQDCIRTIYDETKSEGRGPDWYLLDITPDIITLTSAGENGRFYGVQTLKQIMAQSMPGQLPCCRIEDWPDFPVRAALLDISRDRVPTMETIKQLIDDFASWKYNQFQLYTEHTFAYSRHRQVWKDSSPFTPDEIRELDGYCSDRAIELVPNQNSFGHMERWLMHDDYKHLGESPDGFIDPWDVFREHSTTLAPEEPETLPFLEGLYDELLPCFSSDLLNVGGDEPWELGKGRTSELCQERGLDRVYLDFLLKIRELAEKKGKRIQVYGDIIMKYPHLIKELPDDLILVNWGYEADHPFRDECEKIAESKIPFYVCVGVSSWNSLGGRWSNTRMNIESGAVNGLRFGAEGFVVSEWGDNGHWQQLTAGLPGFLYGAAAAWNVESLSQFEPAGYAAVHLFDGSQALAGAAMKLQSLWECSGVALHNVSLPAVLLLDPCYPYYREDFKKFRGYKFAKEFELLDEAQAMLGKAPDSISRRELLFTAALLRHGCNLGVLQLAADDLSVPAIDAVERRKLAAELNPLIDEYRNLWLERSRPGGLGDSLERFYALKALYDE